ncbi:hexitol phosphatase HxpB [Glaesserella parasuis]|uniref:Hexitol phosphatase HxpB n=3 Tax=Glaesserella parasuis TaxID=738 RepID=A0A084EVU5_GLAPU|nr:hexitol phosphatase HxpB [Glaesserella parasuis]AGO16414.1 2-deoxyglucose-6-phosphatase [Glaesserella parasuis ZJ0906]EQA04304.1 HAD hydrolase, IA, variant 1 family protein [Glaesserella parasuis MN-H]EQA06557.1 HAD hydrolase, IA, variant 1 family protein [Glaesserella parasuis 12939]EQA15307.1 HAD hydrolase, IA, variant 1 family protein [Glaesserella parasuis 174]KEZ22087.1 Phosphatase YniC [Glaesserella parasuis]
MIEAVIFDMDGTLIDSQPIWYQASTEFFQQNQFPVTLAEMMTLTGSPVGTLVDYVLQKYGEKEKSRTQLIEELMAYVVGKVLEAKPLMPNVKDVLSTLKQWGIKIAVASASPRNMLQGIVDSCGIAEYFDYLASAEELEYNKPHPAVYLHAAKQLGVPTSACFAVEDSVLGMISGKAASMKTVVIPEKSEWDDPRWALADYKLVSMSELPMLIES